MLNSYENQCPTVQFRPAVRKQARLSEGLKVEHEWLTAASGTLLGVGDLVLVQKYPVCLANLGGFVVIKEWQESVASATCHLRHRMQERAREHHSSARRRLEAARSIFGKAELPAVEVRVQVD